MQLERELIALINRVGLGKRSGHFGVMGVRGEG